MTEQKPSNTLKRYRQIRDEAKARRDAEWLKEDAEWFKTQIKLCNELVDPGSVIVGQYGPYAFRVQTPHTEIVFRDEQIEDFAEGHWKKKFKISTTKQVYLYGIRRVIFDTFYSHKNCLKIRTECKSNICPAPGISTYHINEQVALAEQLYDIAPVTILD